MSKQPEWLKKAYEKIDRMPPEALEVREMGKESLWFFAQLVNPNYAYGSIHRDIFTWLEDYALYGEDNQSNNKLLMLPRAHLKSHVIATANAWLILRHPEITTLYLSATAELAETQLFAIKNILSGPIFMRYYPEYIHPEVGKRKKWANNKIIIDHPQREKEGIRDATITTAGLTTNTTGWHADLICADDLVIPENAYTPDGRESVRKKSSQFTSIRNNGGFTLAAGTRYHPSDIYFTWRNQAYPVYDEHGEEVDKRNVWDIKEHPVENEGIYLWPRRVRPDGKAYGFDLQSLARIRAEYEDNTQFFAQYYNDPNDPGSERLSREKFQYYNPKFLKKRGANWTYKDNKLNVFAAVDFAYSLNQRADYTAIVVIGLDHEGNIFVLDIDRFKTFKVLEYFNHIAKLHSKWNFDRLNAEVTAAQKTIVESIKDYVKQYGMTLKVEEHRPSRAEGTKEQRIAAVLEPKYENLNMWHLEGGLTDVLEDELILSRPPHDDIKDALASAVSISIKPRRLVRQTLEDFMPSRGTTSRFGGFA